MSYPLYQFQGCCGVTTTYFSDGRVHLRILKQTEESALSRGYGLILGVVRASQYSVKVFEEAGWEKYAVSSGRTGTKLITFGKVLKEYKPRPRKKITEKARVFA